MVFAGDAMWIIFEPGENNLQLPRPTHIMMCTQKTQRPPFLLVHLALLPQLPMVSLASAQVIARLWFDAIPNVLDNHRSDSVRLNSSCSDCLPEFCIRQGGV